MQITKAIVVPARGGHYNEDLDEIRAGAQRDGYFYEGQPQAQGFTSIRQPSEAFSIILILDNGGITVGDGMSVAYSAAGGRTGRFSVKEQIPFVQDVCNYLEGRPVKTFTEMCAELEAQTFDGGLHRAAAFYGATQALVQAAAVNEAKTPAEVLAAYFGVSVSDRMIPINVQCGEERDTGVDKAILKRADVLPHGLINDMEVLGANGERLHDYISWIVKRIAKYGSDDYLPEFHIDVYGMIGVAFEQQVDRMADYIASLHDAAGPYRLCLETPVLMSSRDAQSELFSALREALKKRGVQVPLIVDEWANVLDDIRAFIAAGATDMVNVKSPDLGAITNAGQAILDCLAGGVRPILGGSCTDTDQSGRMMAHLALAVKPAWVLARPGMGIDEGLQIVHNEMTRTLAVIAAGKA